MALSLELIESYTRIIDSIFAASDLSTISAKRVRKGVQAAVDHDISDHKEELTTLILNRFDVLNAQLDDSNSPDGPLNPPIAEDKNPSSTNGNKRASPFDSYSSAMSPPPKKPKHKTSKSVEDADAAFAARLQAQENGRARSTRGGGVMKKKAPVKRNRAKVKAKSKNKIGSDDDSDLASGIEKEVNRTGGFHKPMILSQPLVDLLGVTQLSRPQTVKKIWEYIKANDLQDPNDKRWILCDDNLRSIFKTEKVHMFSMNKVLSQNLYAADE